MSKRQYEDFLVARFCNWAEQNLHIGERIHFRSPDDANSLKLYEAFIRQTQAEFIVVIDQKDRCLPYLQIGNYQVVPVLHAERGVGFTDSYISTLRDLVSASQGQLKNSILLIIHNSSLDTLNNSSRNLCLAEHDVWNPAVIRDALKDMIDPHAASRTISEALLDHQFNAILADGATMFGFRDLYNAVQDGHIEFKELNLLDDPAIGGWDNAAAIEKRLADNKKLKEQIEHLVEQYPSELHEKLKELDFSEKFIKQHFPDGDLASWRSSLDYGECKAEQEKNRENLLELENESVDFGHKVYPGSKADTGAGARERYFIIEISDAEPQFRLNLSFINGQIKDDQVKLRPQDKSISVTLNKRSNKRNVIEVSGSFSGSPTFFSLELKRSKPQENYRYRVLLLPAGAFHVPGFATNFMLVPAKSKIVLQTDSTVMQLAENGPAVTMSENGQEFDVNTTGSVDYETLVNATDRLQFNIRSGEYLLQFDVEGAVSSDSLSLPLLLDKDLHTRLFNDDFYGVFNPNNGKVALDGKELKPRTEHRKLLKAEADLLQQQLLSDAVAGRSAIHVNDLAKPYPDLFADYTELFTYLITKRTLLSLSAWGSAIAVIVKRLVNNYITALQQIQTTRLLSAEEQLLVNLGFANIENDEYLTPYHPLNLAYFTSLTDELQADDTKSFKTLPAPTVRRLNAEGLLPFNWHNYHDFSYSQVVKENPMWLQVVSSRQTQLDYIQRLVRDKTKEFVEAFSTLFASGEKDTLLINSINNGHNKEVLLGLVEFFKKRKPEQTSRIHINLYDEQLQHTYFDQVADAETLDEVKRLCQLTADKEDADSAIDMLRRRITYSKFRLPQAGVSFNYAHLSFVRNNTPVMKSPVDIMAEKSGIACHGLLAGETSYSEQYDYFTTAGLEKISLDAPQLQVMQKYGALCKAAWLGEKYSETSSLALKVSNQLQQLLEAVYEDSIWTTIIDPKVTLKFFKSQKDVVLIHYSDNYTNSANYDAITVTKRRDFYDQILAQGNQGLIDEFNAFNGEWLLKMLTLHDNERREKKSIIAAYKYINCLLFHCDITWVPLSVAEMLRVAGNIGLKMSDADFSRYSQGIRQGAISDDVLFVGFKQQQMYLLPLEVKVGKKQKHDKGVRQAKELKRYLVEQLFGRPDLAGHLYRGLFIRQIFMQIDKYELYRVYAEHYFTPLKTEREWWLQGDYSLADISDYPQGFVLAFIEGEYCNEQYELDQNILQIKLPSGYQAKFVSKPMQALLADCNSQELGFIDDKYILRGKTTPVNVELPEKTVEVEEDEDEVLPIVVDTNNVITFPDSLLPESAPTRQVAEIKSNYEPVGEKLENCRVLIGHSPKTQEAIYWEYGHRDLANRHLIIFGNSGQGKTYCIQGLLMELAKHSINSMVVDYTNGFLPEHLESEFIGSVKPRTDLIADKPLKLNPFKKQKNIVAGTELTDKAYDVATRVASVFKSVYSSIGDQQLPTLIRVIEEGLETYGEQYSFDHMLQALEDYDQTGVKVANKLLPLVKANIFAFDNSDGWNDIYQSKESVCRLIQMARLSRDVWLAAVEFILWDLYSYACLHGDKNSPLPIVLDEVQNLDHRLESPLGKMLTEGRKYGISLILATQTMSNLGKDEQDRLFQASHKLFFAPAMTEVQTYAKLLEQAVPGSDKKYWLSELSKLKKGECISVGMHANANGVLMQSAKHLKVAQLSHRLV
ncbi:DNA phosphorothioation-dependent restriction protein DptH [Shewanella sp.]|uniref:DNA phosphorothioation-dependent restriction protein DptH n=1 Tax=Shewanella sp. TaxID=50422 RepID=UPI0026384D64|nr:DNA phosphorothioation-dependent restriction protein DptH [Shewanella sp.]